MATPTTRPNFWATIDSSDDGYCVFVATDAPVDRKDVHAWAVGPNFALAQRLARAVDAGVVFKAPFTVLTDIDGHTYLGHAGSRVLGRTVNSDLKRLGF